MTKTVELGKLRPFLGTLLFGLVSRGVPRLAALNVIAQHVSASCLQCGITVRGEELLPLIMEEESSSDQNLKGQRLLSGYCARKGCEAHYYEVRSRPCENPDWTGVWTEPDKTDEKPARDQELSPGFSWTKLVASFDAVRLAWFAASLAILLALICWLNRTPSWSSRPSGYQINPSSAMDAEPMSR